MYVYVWFVLISFEVVELLHYCCSTLYACAVCIHHSTNGLNGECFLGGVSSALCTESLSLCSPVTDCSPA